MVAIYYLVGELSKKLVKVGPDTCPARHQAVLTNKLAFKNIALLFNLGGSVLSVLT